MARETWEDIYAYYLNYIRNMQPILDQTRRFLLNMKAEDIINPKVFEEELNKEEKRSVHTVKAIAEFTAMYRREVFGMIWGYIEETKEEFDVLDIKDYTIDFIEEVISALKILEKITNPDQANLEQTLLYNIVNIIQELIFPLGSSKKEIYDILVENSVKYYECQRHLLRVTTYYREDLEDNEIPGISPMVYRIINEITSLFNLDPNYLEMLEDSNIEIPVIMKSDVFDPFIDQIANAEENAVEKILSRLNLRLIHDVFIGPKEKFIEYAETHNYVSRKNMSDGKIRLLPQFSNETLILMYLANVSFRRGFLSRELINWISSNVAFIIYNSILKSKMSDDNIFYPLLNDTRTEEKILPYLMKLICFENYLRIDRTKIRDSIQYRKEIFNTLGSQISAMRSLTEVIRDFVVKQIKLNKNLSKY